MSKVAIVGELNVDLVATGLHARPHFGREVIADEFDVVLGSASAIVACGLSKLGHEVTFVSTVGRDAFGDQCVAALESAGIATGLVTRHGSARTGVTISLSGRHDRMLVTCLGAIGELALDDVPFERLAGHTHLHATSYFLQTKLREGMAELFDRAHALGLTTSFDPNSDPSGRWDAAIWEVFRRTDVLFMNRDEALAVTGTRKTGAAARALAEVVPTVVVKRGRKGALAIEGGSVVRLPAFRVEAVDTTGAGDSFAAGFVAARLEGRPLEECLRRANACGALSTLAAGGTAGQPSGPRLAAFLQEHA